MVKVEVLEDFTLKRFDELKNIQRKSKEQKGRLFAEDIFECTEELAAYLTKNNLLGRAFVRVIEVIPQEENKSKTTKTTTKKETKSKKTIAKK